MKSRGISLFLALLFSLSMTVGVQAQSGPAAVFADIDAFWAGVFAEAGIGYYSPRVAAVEGPVSTACGPIDPYVGPGAYCVLDQTVYFSPLWFGDPDFATDNAAFILVMAHEWSHHLQVLLGIDDISIAEPQADCLAGVYLSSAVDRGVVTPGGLAQALRLVNASGDVPWVDFVGAPHGPGTLRSIAFMSGQHQGLEACGIVF